MGGCCKRTKTTGGIGISNAGRVGEATRDVERSSLFHVTGLYTSRGAESTHGPGRERFPVLALGGDVRRQSRQHDPGAPRAIVQYRGSARKLFPNKRSGSYCSVAACGCVCPQPRLHEYRTSPFFSDAHHAKRAYAILVQTRWRAHAATRRYREIRTAALAREEFSCRTAALHYRAWRARVMPTRLTAHVAAKLQNREAFSRRTVGRFRPP